MTVDAICATKIGKQLSAVVVEQTCWKYYLYSSAPCTVKSPRYGLGYNCEQVSNEPLQLGLILCLRKMDHIMELVALVIVVDSLDSVISTDNPIDAFQSHAMSLGILFSGNQPSEAI